MDGVEPAGRGEGAEAPGDPDAPGPPADDPVAGDETPWAPAPAGCIDDDADGACVADDCDDDNRGVRPGGFEACNGVDDDCDDATDEGLNDTVCGLGACRVTAPNCLDGRPNRCVPGPPSDELCDGIDDDCDGTVDEDAASDLCGVGACARSAECVGGQPGGCTPGEPVDEQCNDVDDDCDGTLNEGFAAEAVHSTYTELSAHHAFCNGSGSRIGAQCDAAMHRLCAARSCKTSGFGPLENSGDVAHVGCVIGERLDPSWAELAAAHDVCDGSREQRGPNCNAAIHRFCAGAGFVSGFGPVWVAGDQAQITCLRSAVAEVVHTTYAELAGHHPPCNANPQRIGPDCNAAISRLCRSRGFSTGYGPVENSGGAAAVTCVRP